MKANKLIRSALISVALGLGIWGAAVSFSTFSFSDGDTLSAAELNTLLNDNFAAAAAAIGDLEAEKFAASGGTITGRTDISGAAAPAGGGPTTLLRVANTADTGYTALFQGDTDDSSATVSIKQFGSSPALSLKNNGSGPLITGAGQAMLTFVVDNNGTIRIGEMGADGTGDPMLTLDAETGTVTNSVGSGLPLAFGSISAEGNISSGTSNFTVERLNTGGGVAYDITIPGENFHYENYTTSVTTNNQQITGIQSTSIGGKLRITLRSSSGTSAIASHFHFVAYKAGN